MPGQAILHIHPTLRCNLSCAHCYSSSSPQAREALAPDLLCAAIADAAGRGFGIVSISGGEPLLYRDLDQVLAAARAVGMRTQIVTNGWFLDHPRYDAVADAIDLVAVSLDGPPKIHRAMRGSAQAFSRFERGTAALRKQGRTFGVVHTVTAGNWEHLFETAAIAAEAGAGLFQIHALELAGRAAGRNDAPDRVLAEKIYIIAALLRVKYHERMAIHIDLEHRDVMTRPCDGSDPAQALGILVLEADGTLSPLTYGFDRRFSLGSVREAGLGELWDRWLDNGYLRYLALRRAFTAQVEQPAAREVFNRYEVMMRLAEAA